ncbi:cation:proton antiporter [Candidatus Woesearchaeota archaeon]|jgi:Kef-type K+ transport system membrane component KefB|nr:cation:proton antiporter [Candidatus Woesearchaeota archaeon]MBT5272294.1 cation:proton antiporter [Candidatus Woesearchaeota archaeon]MBT6040623.1 cation:proton antiporter [Candidatus Woesearchaeota archaeon]MBT7927456.1 cation:proton antiporter [Candidatus Woesearchaeota archaeon]
MDFLLVILICLALSFLLSEVFYRFNYPKVLGPIFAGLILGLPLFRPAFEGKILLNIEFLSTLGIIFLLFLAGLEINIKKLIKAEKDSFAIATYGAAIPFLLGFGLMKYIGYSTSTAFVLGVCLSISAVGTTLKVLLDMKALNTKVGTVMLGAGIIDDLYGVGFLSLILILAQKSLAKLIWFPIEILSFIIITYLAYKAIPKIINLIQIEKTKTADFAFLVIIALTIAIISTQLGLGPIIGAFIAGAIINIIHHKQKILKKHYEEVTEFKVVTFGLIIPFFFINIGLHFDYAVLIQHFGLVVFIVVIAMLGKIIGTLMAKPLTDLSWKQSYLIGWGMNSRGAMELVIAEVARLAGLIPDEVYGAVIIMAILTTMLFPVIIRAMVKSDRKIMY